MKTWVRLGAICVLFISAATLSFGEDGVKNLDKLDKNQEKYYEWTNSKFGGMLRVEDYSSLTESAQKEVAELYLGKLKSLLKYHTKGRYQQEDADKWQAINTLAAMKYQPAVKDLLVVAAENVSKDNRERWMAIRALALIGDDSVVPELIPLTYQSNQNTRIWAQIALVILTGENHGYDWEAWCKSWNKNHSDNPCSPEMVKWSLPAGTDPKYNDPAFQQKSDQEFFQR